MVTNKKSLYQLVLNFFKQYPEIQRDLIYHIGGLEKAEEVLVQMLTTKYLKLQETPSGIIVEVDYDDDDCEDEYEGT